MSTIEKVLIESYKFPNRLANITLNDDSIQIVSEYGDYNYQFGGHGNSFKAFLTSLSKEYLAKKFGTDNWLDVPQTIAYYKSETQKLKDEGDIDDETFEEIVKEISEIESASDVWGNAQVFANFVSMRPNIMEAFCGNPSIAFEIDPRFNKFWDLIWIPFMEELKAELNKNRN